MSPPVPLPVLLSTGAEVSVGVNPQQLLLSLALSVLLYVLLQLQQTVCLMSGREKLAEFLDNLGSISRALGSNPVASAAVSHSATAALGLLLPRALSGKLLSHRRQAIADGKSEAGHESTSSAAKDTKKDAY